MRVSPTLVLPVLVSLVIVSCGSDNSRETELEDRIVELEQQLDRSTTAATFTFATSTGPTTTPAGLTDAEDVWCQGQGFFYLIAAGVALDLDSFAAFDSVNLTRVIRAFETGSSLSAETIESLTKASEGFRITTDDRNRSCRAAYEAFS